MNCKKTKTSAVKWNREQYIVSSLVKQIYSPVCDLSMHNKHKSISSQKIIIIKMHQTLPRFNEGYHSLFWCQNTWLYYNLIQSGRLTRKRVKKKRWKKQKNWWFLPLIALLTASFIMKVEQIVLFKGFLRSNFFKRKKCSRKWFE